MSETTPRAIQINGLQLRLIGGGDDGDDDDEDFAFSDDDSLLLPENDQGALTPPQSEKAIIIICSGRLQTYHVQIKFSWPPTLSRRNAETATNLVACGAQAQTKMPPFVNHLPESGLTPSDTIDKMKSQPL
ncbi:hypothetical protein E4U55_006911 [Claviceps digitariae]|nr:hypothetical protein E4U55_006911 [Claviceps digitariae]